MEIKFRRPAGTLRTSIFMTAGSPPVSGVRLKPEFTRAGRPELITRILIVDDDRQVAKAIARALKKNDLEISLVTSHPFQEQVLNLTAQHQFDLIIMDGNMPLAKGDTIVQQLRESGFKGYVVANSSLREDQTAMLAAGADFECPEKDLLFFNSLFLK